MAAIKSSEQIKALLMVLIPGLIASVSYDVSAPPFLSGFSPVPTDPEQN